MATVTTRLSSRGQVVIPATIRRQLKLTVGEELQVEVAGPGARAIILRKGTKREMEERIARAYSWFQKTGRDLVEELHESRRKARTRERDRPR